MAKLWNAEAELLRIRDERIAAGQRQVVNRQVTQLRQEFNLDKPFSPIVAERPLVRRRSDDANTAFNRAAQGASLSAGLDLNLNIEDPRTAATKELTERVPGAQNLENRHKHILTIQYLPAKYTVEFPAFITQFSDAYNSAWNSEKVYGRMDPMGTFMHTKRNISLAFDVPAESFEHAKQNLYRVNKLVSFLYPVYYRTKDQPIGVMNQDPFWEVTFGNLIQNSQTGGPLLGFVNGITVDPSVEDGFFNRVGPTGKAEYYPKNVRLNFEFTVMHEHQMGFEANVGSKKPIKVQGVGMMDQTVMTYKFNDPKLTFGNFPYVTDQFADSVRTSQNIIPQNSLQAPSIRSARRKGDTPTATGPVTYYDIYFRQIKDKTAIVYLEDLLSIETTLGPYDKGFNPMTMITSSDLRALIETDMMFNVSDRNKGRMTGQLRSNNPLLWKDTLTRFGMN